MAITARRSISNVLLSAHAVAAGCMHRHPSRSPPITAQPAPHGAARSAGPRGGVWANTACGSLRHARRRPRRCFFFQSESLRCLNDHPDLVDHALLALPPGVARTQSHPLRRPRSMGRHDKLLYRLGGALTPCFRQRKIFALPRHKTSTGGRSGAPACLRLVPDVHALGTAKGKRQRPRKRA